MVARARAARAPLRHTGPRVLIPLLNIVNHTILRRTSKSNLALCDQVRVSPYEEDILVRSACRHSRHMLLAYSSRISHFLANPIGVYTGRHSRPAAEIGLLSMMISAGIVGRSRHCRAMIGSASIYAGDTALAFMAKTPVSFGNRQFARRAGE